MPDAQSLKQRHALITGASRGIGAAIARELARAGANLTLLGRDAEHLEALAKTLDQQASICVLAVDITDHTALEAAIQQALSALGPVNILINNAGQALSQPFEKTDLAAWQRMIDVNLTGTYACTRAVLASMVLAASQGIPGRIINVASTAGLKGYPYVTAYVAAKHGVVGLTRALALELARKAITVNAICPGFTDTDLTQRALENIVHETGKTPEQAYAALVSNNPQQRLVGPEEVARTVLWLCQSESHSINGQAIAIDGGELAR